MTCFPPCGVDLICNKDKTSFPSTLFFLKVIILNLIGVIRYFQMKGYYAISLGKLLIAIKIEAIKNYKSCS